MTWETFPNRRARTSNTPTLTIGSRGLFTLNRAAHEALGRPEAVELLYDRDEQTIGIRPADPAGPDSYTLRSAGGAGSVAVSGAAYCRHYGIPTTGGARRRPATVADGILRVDLKNPGIPVTSNRAKQDTADRRNAIEETDR